MFFEEVNQSGSLNGVSDERKTPNKGRKRASFFKDAKMRPDLHDNFSSYFEKRLDKSPNSPPKSKRIGPSLFRPAILMNYAYSASPKRGTNTHTPSPKRGASVYSPNRGTYTHSPKRVTNTSAAYNRSNKIETTPKFENGSFTRLMLRKVGTIRRK